MKTEIERFWAKVEKTATCWIWKGATFRHRKSGKFWLSSRREMTAHHYSYMIHNNMENSKVKIKHSCGNVLCVNPEHLEEDSRIKEINRCRVCKEVKPISEFYLHTRGEKSYRLECKSCYSHRNRKTKHGISKDNYEFLLKEQDGRCAICKRESKLNVDHNHKTGKIRGLLCHPCNLAIGLLEDDPDRMIGAADYIKKSVDVGMASIVA